MTVLTYLLLVVEVFASLLLVGVILLQKSKGQGIGMAFGSGMGESLFGAHAGNVLTKATVVLGIIFLLNTTVLALMGAHRRQESVADAIPEGAAAPAMPMTQEMPSSEPAADTGMSTFDMGTEAAPPASVTGSEEEHTESDTPSREE